MLKPKIFTVILDTYFRPALLRVAVDAIRRQTYENLEIILVNNGGTPETEECLREYESLDKRVKLIHFEENQYSIDDPVMMLDTCLNAGLELATGDYVWYQADDDLIADDYAEKMVALFQGNSKCTTAAGMPAVIDIDDQIIESEFPSKNLRPRYMPGDDLALDKLRGGDMMGAPGTIFTIRRDVLVKAGGFHRALEFSHLYGIVPFGITGFDETAFLYWRNHTGQLNKLLSARGWIGIDESLNLVKDWSLEQRWQVFGADVARGVVRSFKNSTYDGAAMWFVKFLYAVRPSPAIAILRKMWFRAYFWRRVLIHAKDRKILTQAVSPVIKPTVKRLFRTWPALGRLTAGLARLRKKADRWT